METIYYYYKPRPQVKNEYPLFERLEGQLAWPVRVSQSHLLHFHSGDKIFSISASGREVIVSQLVLNTERNELSMKEDKLQKASFISDHHIEYLFVIPHISFINLKILILADNHVLSFDISQNLFGYTKFNPAIHHFPL